MKLNVNSSKASRILATFVLIGLPFSSKAATILVDEPKGVLLKLVKTGKPECGTLDWESIRKSGSFTASGKELTVKEPKLPLSKDQWQDLLSTVVGEQNEITIVQAWPEAGGGLAAALRVAYDIRSHGGKTWVLNGGLGERELLKTCSGKFQFKGTADSIYLSDAEFWEKFGSGSFLDARGGEADNPAPYTWVSGSPRGAKRAELSDFVKGGKVDAGAYSCEIFKGVTVIGCDSIHKSVLAMEAARYKNCESQPSVMPYWGLTGFSRDEKLAKKIWGEQLTLNPKRSGNWENL